VLAVHPFRGYVRVHPGYRVWWGGVDHNRMSDGRVLVVGDAVSSTLLLFSSKPDRVGMERGVLWGMFVLCAASGSSKTLGASVTRSSYEPYHCTLAC
jgi:hypothetical protein